MRGYEQKREFIVKTANMLGFKSCVFKDGRTKVYLGKGSYVMIPRVEPARMRKNRSIS